MNKDRVNGNGSVDAERLRRQRLGEFLRELVREEGRMEAAEMLGVNYRTLVKAEESGELTGRMSDALERLLLSVGGSDEPNQDGQGGQSERLDRLEGEMRALAKELRGGLDGLRAAALGGEAQDRERAQAQAQDGEHGEGAGRSETGAAQGRDEKEGAGWSETKAAPPVAGLRSSRRAKLRRLDPEIVTVEPAEDDVEVYGAAWPLVEEWRRAAGRPSEPGEEPVVARRPRSGSSTLELAMLEEHGLTLPPETQAAAGLRAQGTDPAWRWTALADTRVALRKREAAAVGADGSCTLGLWWK